MDFCKYKPYTNFMRNRPIILLGIKHSGKSTQGRLLSQHFNCQFIDIDDEITKLTGKSPREIYTEKGASGFLMAEEAACTQVAREIKPGEMVVISTGGGICDNAPALNILRQIGDFLLIKVPEKIAADRIIRKATQNEDGSWENLPAYIAKENPENEAQVRKLFHGFYEERSATYEQIADYIAEPKDLPKDENTKLLLAAIS